MIRKFKILMILLFAGLAAFADGVQFKMEAPDVVAMGEQFRLSFTLNNNGSDLQLPDLSNFDVLMGPSTSQSTSMQWINGKTTQTISFSYIFVLRAKKEGKFTIRPASIKVDGKTYESNSVDIQVVKGQPKQANSQQQQNSQNNQAEVPSSHISKENLFVRVDVDKKNVTKGEQLIATVKLYLSPNVPLNGFDDVKLPSYDGFWTKDIDVPSQVNFTREVYNGKIYQVGVLKKTILFPQQTGVIEISPFEITCLVRQRIRQQRSFFDDFFDNYRVVKAKVVSDPVDIHVKDLPSPQPANFSGAVGNFNFSSSIDKTKVKANEAVTLRLTVSGSGNLSLINPPKLNLPQDFEVYDPKTTDKTKASDNGLTGSVTFEYLFIPRYAGDFKIPATQFVFFNPETHKYETRTTDAYNLKVEKGTQEAASTVNSYTKEDVKVIGKDIRFIKQNKIKLKPLGSAFYGTFQFYGIYLLSLIAFIVIYSLNRKKIRENANIALMRNKRANKVALKRLKEASGHLKNNQAELFYEAVIKALWGYLSDKLSIPVADLNREKASASLLAKGVDQKEVTELMKIIDDCEFARYAPAAFSGTMKEVYDGAARLMGVFEKRIK